jgi:hypothetical protein
VHPDSVEKFRKLVYQLNVKATGEYWTPLGIDVALIEGISLPEGCYEVKDTFRVVERSNPDKRFSVDKEAVRIKLAYFKDDAPANETETELWTEVWKEINLMYQHDQYRVINDLKSKFTITRKQ